MGKQRGATNRFAGDTELMLASLGYSFQPAHCLIRDFRADAIAGKDSDSEQHGGLLYGRTGAARSKVSPR